MTQPPMKLPALVISSLALLAIAPAIHAETVNLAGRSVDLPIPSGYCVPKEQGAEALFVSRVRNSQPVDTQLLLVFVNCDELKAMRAANPQTAADGVFNYGLFSVVAFNGKVAVLDQFDRNQFIQSSVMTHSFGKSASDLRSRALDRVRDVAAMKRFETLGLVDMDSNAFYMGSVGTYGKNNFRGLSVVGLTLVKGCQLSVALFTPLEGPDDLSRALARQEANLASLVAAND